MEKMLKYVRIGFPALAEPQAIGDGEPAYGGQLVIEPGSALPDELDALMLAVAKEKWKDDGAAVLAMLKEDGKVGFHRKEYRNKKTGKPYAGFEDKFYLSTRSSTKKQPSVFNKYGEPLVTDCKLVAGVTNSDVERLIYSGCYVNAKVDAWAQDNQFGRRINFSLLGVMFAGDGASFGGGAAPASADDFAGMAQKPDADAVMGDEESVL